MGFIELGALIITIGGLFIWNRTENRADYRHIQSILESQRNMMDEMRKESKDFHGRLCALEEKYYNWLMGKK